MDKQAYEASVRRVLEKKADWLDRASNALKSNIITRPLHAAGTALGHLFGPRKVTFAPSPLAGPIREDIDPVHAINEHVGHDRGGAYKLYDIKTSLPQWNRKDWYSYRNRYGDKRNHTDPIEVFNDLGTNNVTGGPATLLSHHSEMTPEEIVKTYNSKFDPRLVNMKNKTGDWYKK